MRTPLWCWLLTEAAPFGLSLASVCQRNQHHDQTTCEFQLLILRFKLINVWTERGQPAQTLHKHCNCRSWPSLLKSGTQWGQHKKRYSTLNWSSKICPSSKRLLKGPFFTPMKMFPCHSSYDHIVLIFLASKVLLHYLQLKALLWCDFHTAHRWDHQRGTSLKEIYYSNLLFNDSNWQWTLVEARKILKQTLHRKPITEIWHSPWSCWAFFKIWTSITLSSMALCGCFFVQLPREIGSMFFKV